MPPKEPKKRLPGFWAVFKTYWPEVARHPYWLSGVIAGTLLLQVTGLLSPWFLRNFFNELATATPNAAHAQVLFGTLLFVALTWLADWIATQLQRVSNEQLSSRVMERLYAHSFEYLLGHSYAFFANSFTGSLTHKVSRYTRAFEGLFDAIVTQFAPTLIYVTGAIVILFINNHTLGIMLGVWAILFMALQVFLARLRRPARAVLSKADTKVSGDLSDTISNQQTVALFSALGFETRNFGRSVREWGKATLRVWTIDGWTQAIQALFMTAIQVALLFGAIVYWSRGQLTIGDFYLIQAYLLSTFSRLMYISWSLRSFNRSISDAGEMIEILKTPYEVADAPHAKKLTVSAGEILFSEVSFHFNPERPVLADYNVRIAGGEKIALVGPSGAGKTTVTKLLLRLYDTKKGAIFIDGQNIAGVTQESLREAIAFVPQEPILFHRTLMENIRYGRRDATDEEVIAAAKKAHCHEFIDKLPLKYGTLVGERGIKLSGGERQRVAIARAILKNAPILVLDEATSSLDSESEALIQDALSTLMQGKTVLVIAHRLSTIMKMDRIIVLEGGSVVAEGTHEELLKEGGLYQKLWNIQAGGFIVDDLDAQEVTEPSVSESEDGDTDELAREEDGR